MTTTTLKLPDDLKARIAPLAAAEGVSAHAWMVGALAIQAELAERKQAFLQDALAAADEVDSGGEVFAAEDVHSYLRAKLARRASKRPMPTIR